MTTKEESELMDTVREIKTALVGDLTGKNPGALHTLNRVCEDFYRPDNKRRSVDERIGRLEDEKQKRVGFIAACGFIGGLIGFGINAGIAWIKGK